MFPTHTEKINALLVLRIAIAEMVNSAMMEPVENVTETMDVLEMKNAFTEWKVAMLLLNALNVLMTQIVTRLLQDVTSLMIIHVLNASRTQIVEIMLSAHFGNAEKRPEP